MPASVVLLYCQALSFALPFARRLCNTFLPLAVLILFLKPCTFDL